MDSAARVAALAGAALLASAVAGAQQPAAEGNAVPLEATFDPRPAPGDFSLPMPCGLRMVALFLAQEHQILTMTA